MYWEAPELFNAALERFLQQVFPAAASGADSEAVNR
jgi:hypothetical protein